MTVNIESHYSGWFKVSCAVDFDALQLLLLGCRLCKLHILWINRHVLSNKLKTFFVLNFLSLFNSGCNGCYELSCIHYKQDGKSSMRFCSRFIVLVLKYLIKLFIIFILFSLRHFVTMFSIFKAVYEFRLIQTHHLIRNAGPPDSVPVIKITHCQRTQSLDNTKNFKYLLGIFSTWVLELSC